MTIGPIHATFRHRAENLREVVVLTVRPTEHIGVAEYHLTYSEARRLAWGLLADVDPDEVDELGHAIADAGPCAALISEDDRAIGVVRVPAGFCQTVLRGLAAGPMTCPEAGLLIGRDSSTASSVFCQLMSRGLAQRLRRPADGLRALYGITALGKKALGLAFDHGTTGAPA